VKPGIKPYSLGEHRLLDNSVFNGQSETAMPQYIALNTCEICGRKGSKENLCSGCEQWVKDYGEMLPPDGELPVDLQ